MRRFRCDGSQFGHANNLPEGLGSRSKMCCSLFILDPRINVVSTFRGVLTATVLRRSQTATMRVVVVSVFCVSQKDGYRVMSLSPRGWGRQGGITR